MKIVAAFMECTNMPSLRLKGIPRCGVKHGITCTTGLYELRERFLHSHCSDAFSREMKLKHNASLSFTICCLDKSSQLLRLPIDSLPKRYLSFRDKQGCNFWEARGRLEDDDASLSVVRVKIVQSSRRILSI